VVGGQVEQRLHRTALLELLPLAEQEEQAPLPPLERGVRPGLQAGLGDLHDALRHIVVAVVVLASAPGHSVREVDPPVVVVRQAEHDARDC